MMRTWIEFITVAVLGLLIWHFWQVEWVLMLPLRIAGGLLLTFIILVIAFIRLLVYQETNLDDPYVGVLKKIWHRVFLPSHRHYEME